MPDPRAQLASMGVEAYFEGRFAVAADLFEEFVRLVPDDLLARLTLGDYNFCAGKLEDSVRSYQEFLARGGDIRAALERFVRNTAYVHREVESENLLFDEDSIVATCRCLVSKDHLDRLAAMARELTREWNRFREGFAKREVHYEQLFSFSGQVFDLLFVIPPYLNFEAGYPPYGVGVLQAFLRRHGRTSGIADVNLALWEAVGEPWSQWWKLDRIQLWQEPYRFHSEIALLLRPDLQALARLLASVNSKALGFGCFQITRPTTLLLIPEFRRAGCTSRIVLGGPDCFYPNQCTDRYGKVFDSIDAFIVGEGENSTLNLLQALDDGTDLSQLEGVFVPAAMSNNVSEAFRPAAPVPVSELAGFPKFDPDYIERIPEPKVRLLATNRGCVNQCDFCYDSKAWQRFRLRDPSDFVAEIKYNVETHGVRAFMLTDSATNASTKHLEAICDLLAAEQLDITIMTSVMVTDRMTAERYRKMYRAGFRQLFFGIESGSTKVLNAMRKHGGEKEATRNLRLATEAGFFNKVFLIVGHPAEGEAEFEETLRFLKCNRAYIHELSMVNPCTILQNTDLADTLHRQGVDIPEGWQNFSSWSYGDNTIQERTRRKTEAIRYARKLKIPIAPLTEAYEMGEEAPLLKKTWGRIRRVLSLRR
ncbi:MAG: radical SAM protein [bacterium]